MSLDKTGRGISELLENRVDIFEGEVHFIYVGKFTNLKWYADDLLAKVSIEKYKEVFRRSYLRPWRRVKVLKRIWEVSFTDFEPQTILGKDSFTEQYEISPHYRKDVIGKARNQNIELSTELLDLVFNPLERQALNSMVGIPPEPPLR
jgi:hypothetical protein